MKKYFVSACIVLWLVISAHAQKAKTAFTKRASIDTSKFVFVEGGIFKMGTNEPVVACESPAHDVTVKSFYIGKTEVTFDDYDKYCLDTKRDTVTARGMGRGKRPAITVSWNDAVAYCNWLSGKEKLSKCYTIDSTGVKYLDTAKGYRLLTEAEWEFAARGGNKSKGTQYAGSTDLNETSWYKVNSNGGTMTVAQLKPNELGLYDITGNVWEWVWDFYSDSYYKVSPTDNPKGPETGAYRVMRGGAFYNFANYTRVFKRQNSYPNFMQNSVGFRIARTYY
ncbi:MAG: SUMF1/EgtB/PvdO family nonheme iron enzyme [Bacteroidetes bacterium]|nr:SUMF1/EgtB/PvdO family nonheme iron enzyme [Bacteroidota bacterium]